MESKKLKLLKELTVYNKIPLSEDLIILLDMMLIDIAGEYRPVIKHICDWPAFLRVAMTDNDWSSEASLWNHKAGSLIICSKENNVSVCSKCFKEFDEEVFKKYNLILLTLKLKGKKS